MKPSTMFINALATQKYMVAMDFFAFLIPPIYTFNSHLMAQWIDLFMCFQLICLLCGFTGKKKRKKEEKKEKKRLSTESNLGPLTPLTLTIAKG